MNRPEMASPKPVEPATEALPTARDPLRARLLEGLPVRERVLRLAGISTAVLEGGEGPPMILLHGPGEFAAKWLRNIPALVRTHRVIAPDLPAHGASDAGDGSLGPERALAWLAELVERTCDQPPVLVGHVLGGAMALRFAVHHGDRLDRLILVDTLGLAPFRPAPRFALAMANFLTLPSERSYDRFMRQCSYDLDALREEMGELWEPFAAYNLKMARSPHSMAAGRLMRTVGIPSIPPEELRRISVPTALIWGREDRANRLEIARAASESYGWPLYVVERCADDPPRDRPDEFHAALATALRELGGDDRSQGSRPALEMTALNGEPVRVPVERIRALEARLRGPVLRPGEDGWAAAVEVWNGMVAREPALVVQPESAGDVAAAVDFARAHRLLISAKGGGHNIAGTSIAPGGITLDLSRMREVRVDPEARLAHVGPGCRLGEVDAATQAHGLATVLGFVSRTGVAGLTLGGGLGYLTRRFGWTADNLESVEIVTADGRIRAASRDEHPDLFWGIRGAGANLGVVTRFTYRLHEVGPAVYGGLIAWPFGRADEVLAAYRDLTSEAPRELSAWLVLLRAPAAPFVPERWHGQRICGMCICWTGDPAAAEAALERVRSLGEPIVDLLREQPYTEIQSYLDATEPQGQHYYWKTEFAAELPDGLLSTLRDLFAGCPIPDADIGLLHLGGVLQERAWDDGVVGNRDARFAIGVKGMWAPGEPEVERFRQWVRAAWTKLRPFSTGGNYINFQTADEDEERVRATYGPNFDRLVEVKSKYDPENLFRSNRNVRPASG